MRNRATARNKGGGVEERLGLLRLVPRSAEARAPAGEAQGWLAATAQAGSSRFLSAATLQALLPCALGRFRLTQGMRIYDEGIELKRFFIILSGWACQYRILSGGQRHIRKFLLPGDLVGFHPEGRQMADHSAASLTPVELLVVDGILAARAAAERIEVLRDLAAHARREEVLAWDRLTCVARTAAIGRVAHLLHELCERLSHRQPRDGDLVALPLTQEQIGDAVGLSAVHVNRMLAELRQAGILTLGAGRLAIHDAAGFAEAAGRDL